MNVEGITETTQYLSFKLDEEEFALDISKVREVLDFTRITKVPQTPGYMKGVINLRGSVVPVVDLNKKFGIKDTQQTVNTRIIIGEVEVEGESTVLGVLADSVHEVIELEPENIEPAPKIGAASIIAPMRVITKTSRQNSPSSAPKPKFRAIMQARLR